MFKRMLYVALIVIIIIIVIWLVSQRREDKRAPVLLSNSMGVVTTEFQLYETIIFDAVDLSPRTGYEVQIVNEAGDVIRNLAFSTDQEGSIPATVLWYNIGIPPCGRADEDSMVFRNQMVRDYADYSFAGRNYTINLIHSGQAVRQSNFQVVNVFTRPLLYAADVWGCPKSGFLIGEEDIWVIGKNFPKGSLVRLWAVPANSDWRENDRLEEQTKQYGYDLPPLFELKADETEFKKLLWPKNLTSVGSFDIVAEVIEYDFGRYRHSATADASNVLSYKSYSGFVIQRRPGAAEPLEVDIAGSASSPYTFRNTFLTTENVYVGVDPCMQPLYVGLTANVFIVQDKTDAEWTQAAINGTDLNTLDVTGFVETITVGGTCANCWKTLAWTAPLTPGKYDVVLDFDMDDKYTPGYDLIDALVPAGFIVADIRINTISFNYSGSGAITIYDNINGSNISPPEYFSANHVVKPAAWIMGGTHSVQVEFKAVSSVSNAEIWAEGTLMSLNSSSSPVTVTFPGGTGTATFNANNPPGIVGKHEFFWDWKYKNVNGTPSGTTDMGETGEHLLYTTYATPNAPMTTPWLEVIDSACIWAGGESNITSARTAVTAGLNNIGDLDGDIDYVTYSNYSGGTFSAFTFNLTQFLMDLGSRSNLVLYCADCAGALQVYCNAIGLDLGYVKLNLSGTTNYFDPIGNGNPSNSTDPQENWQTIGWGWHCVGWLPGNIIYDACLHLDGQGSPASCPCSRLAPVNMSHSTYCGYLIPSSSTCSLADINVVTVY